MKQKPRHPRIDPQPGDRFEHVDGGTMYVMKRKARKVGFVRQIGWSLPESITWMRLSTFTKVAR